MMQLVNRSALIVRPKDPYMQWAANVWPDAGEAKKLLRDRVTVYLVAADPQGREESAPIEGYYDRIFEFELNDCQTDRDSWPKKRDFGTFERWFDVQAESLVIDLDQSSLESKDLRKMLGFS